MKRLLLLCLLVTTGYFSFAQSADEAINRFLEGNGGKDRLSAITSLEVKSVIKLEQMGMESPLTVIKEKNKLFRMQSTSPMGGDEGFTVITDTAGYTFTPAIPGMGGFGGAEATLTKLSPEEILEQSYQKDCAGFFGHLVNYAEKGHTATLLDSAAKVNDVVCDKVKLKLKSGQEMIYYIAKNNGQIKRVNLSIPVAMEMMGMSGMMKMFGGAARNIDRKIDIDYDKYKLFEGFPFPTKQILKLGPMDLEVENTEFKVNQPVEPKWYLAK